MEVQSIKKKLALLGGDPLRTRPFPAWPVFDEREERGLLEVLHSGKWWRFSYGEGVSLENRSLASHVAKSRSFRRLLRVAKTRVTVSLAPMVQPHSRSR
jgi:hypothetical protein